MVEALKDIPRDCSSWMTNLPVKIRSQPLNHLAIPGSHNSFTYAITDSSVLSPDCPVYKYFKWFPPAVYGPILHPWTTTEVTDVATQLDKGIRYFDLRVAVHDNDTFWLAHGQFALPIFHFIKAMLPFLDDHPKEVVLLDVNHAYAFESDEQKLAFETGILELIGPKMIPQAQGVPSIEEMWSSKYQVIFFSCIQGNYVSDERFWRQLRIQSFWPDVDNAEKMIEFLDSRYGPKYPRSPDMFSVYQFILTISESDIFKGAYKSLRELAQTASAPSLKWLQQPCRRAGLNEVGITIIDFCVEDNPLYIKTVINLNYTTWPT